jgi:hypothetical protein
VIIDPETKLIISLVVGQQFPVSFTGPKEAANRKSLQVIMLRK